MANDNLIGKTINGYQVESVIGRGGMAAVYRAQQVSMGRTVALKVLPQQYLDDDTYIQRFQREVAIISRLEHRNIVPVYDYGEYEGQPYIVMRHMSSSSVDNLLKNGPLSVEKVLEIIQQIAPALDYAHAKSVLHRDLKPSNILLDDEGAAYLTDFGIARVLGEAAGSTITTQGVVGTPAYMSPEQAQGRPLDGRSDVYALGVVLFELLTGRRPFESDTPYGVAVMQVTTPPPQPRGYNPALPPAVESVVYRALEKSPERRFQSAMGLAKALDAAWNRPDEVRDTQKRHATPPAQIPVGVAYQPSYTPPQAGQRPAPYVNNAWNANPAQAAWVPVVDATAPPVARPRRRGGNPWLSLMLGLMLGCLLLTGVLGAAAYFLGTNFDALFGPPAAPTATGEVAITPGGIQIMTTPQATRTPFGGLDDEIAATLPPTALPIASTATFEPITSEPVVSPTPTFAPIGVRPGETGAIDPTGDVVYFNEADGNYDLYRLNLESGRVRRLTYVVRVDQFPAVSPDGRLAAFVGMHDATLDVRGDADVVTVYDGPGYEWGARYSPTGEHILFSSDADGRDQLYVFDGETAVLLTENGGYAGAWVGW